ncbi:MAG: transketolase C-terminal domain-containing protein [Bryobacteraceae bacterium]
MRTAFIEALEQIAARDPRVWLLCGDLGYSVLERFASRFPDRFVNAGVAEQNMTGMAAGLAMAGKKVFTYSIANFPVMRCLEQIRNDVAYHNLDVTIVAVGGGLSYGSLGYSHHGVEDLAAMRVLPNMAVLAPADPVEARLATAALAVRRGPGYLRLGKAGEPVLHTREPAFASGRAIEVRHGETGPPQVTLLATGAALAVALDAAQELAEQGIEATVASMPWIAPFDDDYVRRAARSASVVATIEEHGAGGLAECVAMAMATGPNHGEPVATLLPFRLAREPVTVAGSQGELRDWSGLDPRRIAAAVSGVLSKAVPIRSA